MRKTILLASVIIPMVTGCQGSNPLQHDVVFQGTVRSGHLDANKSVIPDAPLSGASVTCEGFSGAVRTAADGSYQLKISHPRTFDAPGTDMYTVTAQSAEGLNEKIIAAGRPGETVLLPAFVLYQHTEEQ